MSPPLPNNDPLRAPDAIEQEALQWIARMDRGLNQNEKSAFDSWRASDARHAALFDDYEDTWTLLERVRELPEHAGGFTDSNPSAFARSDDAATSSTTFPRWPRFPRRVAIAIWGAAAAIAVALLGVSLIRTHHSEAALTSTETTALGELRVVTLPDGSIIRLNTESLANIRFTPTERHVRLTQGEAHFTVAKDARRPFTVSAVGVTVRAVGTAFNVRLLSEVVEVLVTQGTVRVSEAPEEQPAQTDISNPAATIPPGSHLSANDPLRPKPNHALSAGEVIQLSRVDRPVVSLTELKPVTVSRLEMERVLAWHDRRLEFVDASLATMIVEFNRYNRHKLVIADAALAAQRFGGNFKADDPGSFVRVLEASFGIQATGGVDETVLHAAR